MKIMKLIPFFAVLFMASTLRAQIPGEGTPPAGGDTPPAAAPPAAAPPAAAPPAAAPPASAPPPSGAAKTPADARNKGLLLIGGFGVNGCTEDACNDIDPLVYLRIQVLYRVFKYFAAGLHLAFLFEYPEDEPSGVDYTIWNVVVGAEARGIFPWKKLDFWMGLIFGYQRSQIDAEGGGGSGSQYFNAFTLGWGFGADYYITKNIGLGGAFYLYNPFPEKGCVSGDLGSGCTDLSNQAKDDIGLWWSFGFQFTYFLPM